MRWRKTCKTFKKTRDLINNEGTVNNCMQIMYAIEACCDELAPDSDSEWVFYDSYRDLKSEIHDEVEYMDEDDYESCENTVNYYLKEFYDLCDAARVWLDM